MDEARQMLAEIYSWFTEGFNTKDLQEAKALLDAWGSGYEDRMRGRDSQGNSRTRTPQRERVSRESKRCTPFSLPLTRQRKPGNMVSV